MSIQGEGMFMTVYVQDTSVRIHKKRLRVASENGASQPAEAVRGDVSFHSSVPFEFLLNEYMFY